MEEYLQSLVSVFREVRRVLRTDGTLWVNMGDSYEMCIRDRALFVAVCVVMVAKAYSEEPAAEPAAPEASAAPAAILPTELLFTAAAEEE